MYRYLQSQESGKYWKVIFHCDIKNSYVPLKKLTLNNVVPGSLPAKVLLSTISAILGSSTCMKSLTRSVTSTSQFGPSIVITWSVPSEDVVWNWVKTCKVACWYWRVQPRFNFLSSSSSSSSLSRTDLPIKQLFQ